MHELTEGASLTKKSSPALIAIDWGSSKFRAYLLDDQYRIIDKIETMDGMLRATRHPHEIFTLHCQLWLTQRPDLPVIMSGTVGSNIGWVNTHYVSCPLAMEDLHDELVPVENEPDINIKIVPGVTGESLAGTADVMRGEEVQVFGALERAGKTDACVCLPGTHSKWVTIRDKKITHFSSFMSGEFYYLTRMKSSISSIVDRCEFENESFIHGLVTAEKPGGLLHHLFSARANSLVKKSGYSSISSYISGVIIGSEINEVLSGAEQASEVILVANDGLSRNYGIALNRKGIDTINVTSEDAFVTGISIIDPLTPSAAAGS